MFVYDLKLLKNEVSGSNVASSIFNNVIDRAIAAESEIELKENEINKLVLRTANSENELAKCLNERDELKAKLAEIDGIANPKVLIGQLAEEFKEAWPDRLGIYDWLVGRSITYKSPSPSQRITEQDAREICHTYNAFRMQGHALEPIGIINKWLRSNDGKSLLDKLNERRTPEVNSIEPVATVASQYRGAFEIGNVIFSENKQPLINGTKLYAEPVTANKAEVPESRNIIKVNRCSDHSVIITFSSCRSCSAFINSLPPLKDGE